MGGGGVAGEGAAGGGGAGGGGAGGTRCLITQQQALDLAVGGVHETRAWLEDVRQNLL